MFNYNQNAQQGYGINQQSYVMNQQSYGMNQQNFYPQQLTIEQQKQQNQQMHLNDLQQTLKKIYELQNQPQLQSLFMLLRQQQKRSSDQITKAIDQSDVKAVKQNEMKTSQARGQKIRVKNAQLLNKLLRVKAKMERLMYQDINSHSKYEFQTGQVMDKIRGLKSEITQKIAYLKTLKVNKSQDLVHNRNQSKSQSSFATIGSGMTQLAHGTQILQRQVVKQKAQMELVIKYINDQN